MQETEDKKKKEGKKRRRKRKNHQSLSVPATLCVYLGVCACQLHSTEIVY